MAEWFLKHFVGNNPCQSGPCLTVLAGGLGISQVICVFEVVILLTLLSRKTRTAANGSMAAAIDCILPAYRSALTFIICAYVLQLVILVARVLFFFDPEKIFYFFVFYSEQETFTFFFLTTSVTKRSLRRAIMWAMLWGLYTSVVAYFVAALASSESRVNDLHVESPWVGLALAIDGPRFLGYTLLVKYVSVRPRLRDTPSSPNPSQLHTLSMSLKSS